MHAQTAMIENGFVYLSGTVAVSLSARADDTPSGRHNDQVNSTLQFPIGSNAAAAPATGCGP